MGQVIYEDLPSSTRSGYKFFVVGFGNSGNNIINYMKVPRNTTLLSLNLQAENLYELLRQRFERVNVVFVATGLGGRAGTANAPIIARIAKEAGVLTIGIVSMPFSFEGYKRRKKAEEGLRTLKNECDSVVVIPNDNLLSIIDPKAKIKIKFRVVDNIFSRVIHRILGVIVPSGENDMNLDLADLQRIMIHRGVAVNVY